MSSAVRSLLSCVRRERAVVFESLMSLINVAERDAVALRAALETVVENAATVVLRFCSPSVNVSE